MLPTLPRFPPAVFNSWDRQVYEFPDENGQPTTLRPNTIIRGNIGISNYNSVRRRLNLHFHRLPPYLTWINPANFLFKLSF